MQSSKAFYKWLKYQQVPLSWDRWEHSVSDDLCRKAWEAGRKYEIKKKKLELRENRANISK